MLRLLPLSFLLLPVHFPYSFYLLPQLLFFLFHLHICRHYMYIFPHLLFHKHELLHLFFLWCVHTWQHAKGRIIAAPLIPKCVPVFYPFCIKSRVGSKCLSRPRNRRKICICIPAGKLISIFRRSRQRIRQARLLFFCYLTATVCIIGNLVFNVFICSLSFFFSCFTYIFADTTCISFRTCCSINMSCFIFFFCGVFTRGSMPRDVSLLLHSSLNVCLCSTHFA